MKQKKLFFIIIVLLLINLVLFFSFTLKKDNTLDNFYEHYGIYPVKIPEKINFAGEDVPIHNFDVKESLDRELLINTYWQSQTLLLIKKSNRYFPLIEPILKEAGIPDDFKYLAVAESGLSNVTSPSGAKGFWQFLEGTANDFDLEVNSEVDERYHLEKATKAACEYLKKSYAKYKSWATAAASYNMGRRNVSKQIDRQKTKNYYDLVLGAETGRYLYRVIALKLILENPEKYGFYIQKNQKYSSIPYTLVRVDTAISQLADFAYEMGINYKVLKLLNPWLRDNKLTNKTNKTYEIKIAKKDWREVIPDTEFYNDTPQPSAP